MSVHYLYSLVVKYLTSCVLFFVSCHIFAAPNVLLEKLFKENFFTLYESRECYENIVKLALLAQENQVDLSNASIIEIRNSGLSVFGLVNAEYARASGSVNPSYPVSGLKFHPGERNWHNHVILESEGIIYDFDFGNSPQPITTSAYIEKMFLNEKTREEGGEFFVGREEKIQTYQVYKRSILETLDAYKTKKRLPFAKTSFLVDHL